MTIEYWFMCNMTDSFIKTVIWLIGQQRYWNSVCAAAMYSPQSTEHIWIFVTFLQEFRFRVFITVYIVLTTFAESGWVANDGYCNLNEGYSNKIWWKKITLFWTDDCNFFRQWMLKLQVLSVKAESRRHKCDIWRISVIRLLAIHYTHRQMSYLCRLDSAFTLST